MSKFDQKSPKGSVQNCQSYFVTHDPIRWFKCKLKPPNNCRAPNHSLITINVELSAGLVEGVCGNTLGSREVNRTRVIRKVGENYMESETALRLLPTMLEQLKDSIQVQSDMDNCYDDFVKFLSDEAERSVPKN